MARPVRSRRGARRLAAAALVGVMAVGSAIMWLGAPLGLLWLASHLQHGTDPRFAPYALVVVGLPVAMALIARGLSRVERVHQRLAGTRLNQRRVPRPWLRSLRGERGSFHQRTTLDTVMIVTVLVVSTGLGIWFFGFAGSSLPR